MVMAIVGYSIVGYSIHSWPFNYLSWQRHSVTCRMLICWASREIYHSIYPCVLRKMKKTDCRFCLNILAFIILHDTMFWSIAFECRISTCICKREGKPQGMRWFSLFLSSPVKIRQLNMDNFNMSSKVSLQFSRTSHSVFLIDFMTEM